MSHATGIAIVIGLGLAHVAYYLWEKLQHFRT